MSAPATVAGVEDAADRNVEMWKIKKLIKSLELARGNGTSMISLIIPPRDQIARVQKMLADEYGTASNIKSRVNRLSVLGAITSVQGRLKLYSKGFYLYFIPLSKGCLFLMAYTLFRLLADDNKFGFIIMDGNGCLFGTLQGNTREVLHKFTVDLPKKHGIRDIFILLILTFSQSFI
uniref:Eukaryotic peptide chain release factor subunit 1 n=1 Tax=Heterorhabditis bacteriophora TaxID=37862 RepID=A0A1I7XPR0_HETBA